MQATHAPRAAGWAAGLVFAAVLGGCASASNTTATAPRYEIKRVQVRTLPAAELAALRAAAAESAAAAAMAMDGYSAARPVAN